MSIRVRCPGCGKPLKYPDEAQGNRGKCKHCKTVFRLAAEVEPDVGPNEFLTDTSASLVKDDFEFESPPPKLSSVGNPSSREPFDLIVESLLRRGASAKEWISNQEAFDQILEVHGDVANAIHAWPETVVAVYERGEASYVHAIERARNGLSTEPPEWLAKAGLNMDHFALLNFFFFTTSFATAWYHLDRDKQKRDPIANSAVLLVSSLGLDLANMMVVFMDYEFAWRRTLVAEGFFRRPRGCATVIVLAIVLLSLASQLIA